MSKVKLNLKCSECGSPKGEFYTLYDAYGEIISEEITEVYL